MTTCNKAYETLAQKARGFVKQTGLWSRNTPRFWNISKSWNISGNISGLCNKLVVFLVGTLFVLLLSACATTSPGPYTPDPTGPTTTRMPAPIEPGGPQGVTETTGNNGVAPTTQPESTPEIQGLTPAFMAGKDIKRVALLLPFSAKSKSLRQEANSMLRAAELAIFNLNDDNVLLMTLDSAGTVKGAEQAAKTALEQGADIILGPVLAKSVRAAGDIAYSANIPVIGFSTDTSVAGMGVYLLSFPPEAEVRRITQFAAEAGASKFAFLGPTSTYGKRVLNAYSGEVTRLGGLMAGVETYKGKDITVMQEPAARLANMFPSPEETAENPEFDDPYHVILLPEGGTALRSLAPLLTFYNENTRHVQIMGTGLWNRDEAAKEPALAGGIFAGPDMEGRLVFNANYDASYAEDPSRLASLAFDAVNIAAFIAEADIGERRLRLIDPAGFFGVDGLIRFTPQGTPERGLAVYQIQRGRFVVISAAPKSTVGAF